jgi:hypothetical protein
VKTKLIVCVITSTLMGATLAVADNLDEAKAAFADGRAAFERGDFERALTQFQRANSLAPAPSLSYNMGKTYEKLGRYREAVSAFERYLEQMGAPANNEDKKFQDDLRLRIEADRQLPERAPQGPAPAFPPPASAPPTSAQPSPSYPPQPYAYDNRYQPAYNPYAYQAPMATPRELRLASARRKRTNGVVRLVVGSAFLILGSALTADACARTLACSFSSSVSSTNRANGAVELAFSVPSLIVGLIVTPIGIANLAVGAREVSRIEHEPPPSAPAAPGQPQAFMFSTPTIRF